MASVPCVVVNRPSPHVVEVVLNRPDKMNAYSQDVCKGLVDAFTALASDTEAYVVILRAEGKHFCAGLDLAAAGESLFLGGDEDMARKTMKMRQIVQFWQEPCNLLVKLPQVTIACVQGACVGAGVEFSLACDIRYCSADAKFSIKEVDVGLAADLGSLHRMPMVTGNMSWVRELVFTGRSFGAEEAMRFGFTSHVAADQPALLEAVGALARTIAGKSPVALRTAKEMCSYAESHGPEECMHQVRMLNSAMLQTNDLAASVQAFMTKKTAVYSKL